ncbi:hypothetical protein DENSPDRAFT_855509 [Dentipellis sp. KUC8613]|nr:hypothetical protein DENSPDRAFT_855509 [Dentipellis sp. KUC8613]
MNQILPLAGPLLTSIGLEGPQKHYSIPNLAAALKNAASKVVGVAKPQAPSSRLKVAVKKIVNKLLPPSQSTSSSDHITHHQGLPHGNADPQIQLLNQEIGHTRSGRPYKNNSV